VRSRKLEAPQFALFEAVDGAYHLRFTREMDGRLGLRGEVKSFAELRVSGLATREDGPGEVFRIALPKSPRGKVVIGGTTLLFELVPAPLPEILELGAVPAADAAPARAREGLPAAVRAGLFADVDWYFTAFVVSTFLLFFFGFILLETYDPVVEDNPALVTERYARFIFDEPTPPPPPPEEVEPEESDEEADATETAPEPSHRSPSREASSAPATDERRASLTQEIGHQVETAVMGAVSQIEGSLGDALAAGLDMRVSAADAIAQAQGIGVADGTAGSMLTREGGSGTGSGERGGLGALAGGEAGGRREIATREVVENQVRGRVGIAGGGITGGAGDFDSSVVRQMISRRIRAIQACYERSLRQSPNAAGRVVVRFTIETSGTVSGASAAENTTGDPGVATCVVETVSRFRFSPGPTGGSVTVSYPFVFAPQS
ncbi:MAG: TonB family protein, partial [Polyangiaceae bacterium]|nr:TonB family protein [Polyangiaceae bacterium]